MIALGTKIRITDNRYNDPVTVGNTYSVIRSEPDTYRGQMPVAVADDNDGWVVWLKRDQFEMVDTSDELQQLRDWKAAALARFPALAEPESDEDAIARFTDAWDNEGFGEGWNDILREAFTWARANPR